MKISHDLALLRFFKAKKAFNALKLFKVHNTTYIDPNYIRQILTFCKPSLL